MKKLFGFLALFTFFATACDKEEEVVQPGSDKMVGYWGTREQVPNGEYLDTQTKFYVFDENNKASLLQYFSYKGKSWFEVIYISDYSFDANTNQLTMGGVRRNLTFVSDDAFYFTAQKEALDDRTTVSSLPFEGYDPKYERLGSEAVDIIKNQLSEKGKYFTICDEEDVLQSKSDKIDGYWITEEFVFTVPNPSPSDINTYDGIAKVYVFDGNNNKAYLIQLFIYQGKSWSEPLFQRLDYSFDDNTNELTISGAKRGITFVDNDSAFYFTLEKATLDTDPLLPFENYDPKYERLDSFNIKRIAEWLGLQIN